MGRVIRWRSGWERSASGRRSPASRRRWSSCAASSPRTNALAYDLLIRGGTLVDDRGARAGDLAVRGECIAAVTAPGVLSDGDAERVLSAGGGLLLPRGVGAPLPFDFWVGDLVSRPLPPG